MPRISTQTENDPVSRAIANVALARASLPIPLVATSYDICISGGLAAITARRTFRNQEAATIEATLTFPMPVHAVMHSLEANIAGRAVKAIAQAKSQARETYEDAIDRGKTAVLHEELLRGVHMLTVGHVAPGAEIIVTVRFALALSFICGRALLRIPTTVGDVYGASGLPDADDLIHCGTVHAADLTVMSDCGTPVLLGGTLDGGAHGKATARVWLDAPINIEVRDWTARAIAGRAADGSAVSLSIAPAPVAENPLDIGILVDHSGSMADACCGDARVSKHAAVLLGLTEAADDLTVSDRLNLWEFDQHARDLGTARSRDWRTLLRSLSGPNGGTEIGGALTTLLAQRPVRDILLITDGKSHSLNVQELAASGARFTVVLIGEDSLEANVGYLAALTGGEIFVADGADVTAAVRSALRALRSPRSGSVNGSANEATTIHSVRCGMMITAAWSAAGTDATARTDDEAPHLRAAAAYAASLRLPSLSGALATQLAVAEGLVTHLTSLVLVDETSITQQGLPSMRKVALPSPRTASPVMCFELPADAALVSRSASKSHVRQSFCHTRSPQRPIAKMQIEVNFERSLASLKRKRERQNDEQLEKTFDPSQLSPLARIAHEIDWRQEGSRLAEGIVVGLAPDIADAIDAATRNKYVMRSAKRHGLTARALIIGLIARLEAGRNRYAERVMRAVLGKTKASEVESLARAVGLGTTGEAA